MESSIRGVVVPCVGLAVLMVAMIGGQQEKQERVITADKLEVKELVVRDATGKYGATLAAEEKGFFLKFWNGDREASLTIGIEADAGTIVASERRMVHGARSCKSPQGKQQWR